MSNLYKYNRTTFPKGKALLIRLRRELGSSLESILTGLRSDAEEISFSFSRALNESEISTLEQAIVSHDGDEKEADRRHGKTVRTIGRGRYEGEVRYIMDSRKRGEGANRGTGTMAYWSAGRWRRFRDDRPVQK